MRTSALTSLDTEQRRTAGQALRATVIDLIDLGLIAKQAHWTVVGRDTSPIRQALDELVGTARDFTDRAAERSTAIGVAPDGRAGTVARESSAHGCAASWQRDSDVIDSVTGTLFVLTSRLRDRIEATESADSVTQDLFIEIVARLEQAHWMWQAHIAHA